MLKPSSTSHVHSGALWTTAPATHVLEDARRLVLSAGAGALRHHCVAVWAGSDTAFGSRTSRTEFVVNDASGPIDIEVFKFVFASFIS